MEKEHTKRKMGKTKKNSNSNATSKKARKAASKSDVVAE